MTTIKSYVQSFSTQADIFKTFKGYSFMNCESLDDAVGRLKIYGNDNATVISQLTGTHPEFRSVLVFTEDTKSYFVNTCRV